MAKNRPSPPAWLGAVVATYGQASSRTVPPRATTYGHAWHRTDNQGHFCAAQELASSIPASMNASPHCPGNDEV
jgi:hypothetical protein